MKLDELTLFLNSHNVDIACITETWLKTSVPDTAINIDGYTVIRRDRCDDVMGGGVCIYIRDTLKHTLWTQLHDDEVESVWVTIRPRKLPREVPMIAIGVLYMPPGCTARPRKDREYVSHILHSLDTISHKHPETGICVVGDFNHMKDKYIKTFPLKQIVKSPTHMLSIIDCVYTNLNHYYKVPELFPGLGLSMHKIVLCAPNIVKPNRQTVTLRYRINSHTAKTVFVDALKRVNWTPLYNMLCCQEMYDFFNNTLTHLLDTYLPYRTVTKHVTDKPWVTDDFKAYITKRQKHLNDGNVEDFNRYRNIVNRKSKSLRSNYYKQRVESLSTSNSRSWWKKTQELIGLQKHGSNKFSTMAESQCGGDMMKLASEMNEFFQSVSSHLEPIIPPRKNTSHQHHIPHDYVISLEALEHKLLHTDIHKSIGPDDLPNWILRDLAGIISAPICAIFNQSIREGTIPTEWKRANVTPLPKVHPPKTIQSDIRPISLTSTLSKYLESFISNWILQHLNDNLDPHQYGALKGLSTTHALVDLLHHVHEIIHKNNTVRICFIDYSKAFDLIDHTILIRKFTDLGVHKVITTWLSNYLSNREQRVKIGKDMSSWLQLNGAVPQGSCLGPLCFIVYMSDMRVNNNMYTHKYIDDITITESVPSNDVSVIQSTINNIKLWSDNNNMKLNERKTKEMLISFKRHPAHFPTIEISGNAIERVNHFKILGVFISDNLSWKQHVTHMISKASPRLYYLRQLRRCGLSDSDLLKFYKSIVRPILEYACPVWHPGLTGSESQSVEQIQRRALKIICPNISYEEALHIADLELLSSRRSSLCKQFFNEICDPTCKLNYLLTKRAPSQHNTRNPHMYQCPIPKTERYKGSFIIHNLLKQ